MLKTINSLLVCACLAALLAILVGSIPSEEKKSARAIQTTNQPKEKESPANEPLAAVPGRPSETLGKKSNGDAQQREEEGTEFYPPIFGYRIKVTDSLLVLFNALLFVFTGLLWQSTEKLWKAGERQFQLSRDEFNATHRPRIIVRKFQLLNGLPDTVDEQIEMICDAYNKGDAPGTIIEVRSAKLILKPGEKIPGKLSFPYAEKFDRQLVSGEHDFFPLNGQVSPEGWKNPLGIIFNETTLYAIGTVIYVGTDNRRRETGFCRRYEPNSETWEIVAGEYEDDY